MPYMKVSISKTLTEEERIAISSYTLLFYFINNKRTFLVYTCFGKTTVFCRICRISETENASKFGVRNLGSYSLVRLRRAGAESLKKQRKVITNNNITISNL